MLTRIATGREDRLRNWQATNPHMAYGSMGGIGEVVKFFWWLDTYWVTIQRHDGRHTVPVDSISILSPAY